MTTFYRSTKRLSKFKNFTLLLAGMLFAGTSFAALSGSGYVIDKGGTASATVYKSFSDFISDLNSGTRSDGGTANGPGISGAVTVTVATSSGPYTEQLVFSPVAGASSTNTITIDGNGETIQYTSSSSSTPHTILLDGADYLIFDNLVVRALGSSYGRCFWLRDSANSNVIQNCALQMPNVGTSSYNAYIAITDGTTSPTSSTAPGQNNVIKNNVTSASSGNGPYYGFLAANSSSTSVVQKNHWEGNVIKDFYYYGLYFNYMIDQTIINNEITNLGNLRTGTKYAMYLYNYYKGGGHTIVGNYVHDLASTSTASYLYGIYLYGYFGDSRSEGLTITDNTLIINTGAGAYGMYLYMYQNLMTGKFNVSDNYLEINQVSSGSYTIYGLYNYCYYMNAASSFDVQNNEILIQSQYYAYNYNMFGYSTADVNIINNKYNSGAGYYAMWYNYGYGSSGKWTIAYNTVNVMPGPGVTAGTGYTYLYFYELNGATIVNNNFYSDLDNNYLYIYGYFNGSGPSEFDYNNVHFDDATYNTYYLYWGTTNYTSVAAWLNATGGTNNISIRPEFADVNNNDLTPLAFDMANKGRPLTGVTTDYRGITRNAVTPDIGCYEYFIDVEIVSIDMTGGSECGGYMEPVVATIKNHSDFDLKKVPLQYTINGGTPVKETVNVLIASGQSYQYTFNKVPEFNGTNSHTIEVSLDGKDDDVSNSSQTYVITTIKSPYGSELTADPNTFPGYFQLGAQGGILTNPDVTVPGVEIEYEITEPAELSNGDYPSGTVWVLNPLHMTSGGVPVTSGITFTAPSAGGNGSIAFDPDVSLVDSLVYIGFSAHDYNSGCDSTFGRWVYIPHFPTPDFDVTDVCDGEVVAFTDKSEMDQGLIIYEWNFDDLPSLDDNTSEISDPVHTFTTYGTYDVTLTTSNFAYPKFKYTITKSVTVKPIPVIGFKVKNACEGEDIIFQNQTVLPGGLTGTIDYIWDFADGSPMSNLENPTHQFSAAGGYKVKLSANFDGCVATLTKNANQFARPVANFTVNGNCNLEETQFNNLTTIALGNTGYSWDFNDGSVSNLQNPAHKFQDFGSHTVTLTAVSEFGCEHEKQVTFTLNESPKAEFTFSDPCNLSDIDFTRTGTIPSGNSIYEWDFDGESISTQQNPSYRFVDIGVRKVTLKVSSDNGCSDMITKEIVVKLQAKADFTATDVCEGQDVVFTNRSSVAAGDLSYTWRFGDQSGSNLTSPRHPYSLNNPNITETFNVTLVANVLGGCADSITRPVTVNAKADPFFVAETSGRELEITDQRTTNPAFFYKWRFGDGGSSTDVTPTYSYFDDMATREVCLVIINDANCLSEYCQEVEINLLGMEELDLNNGMVDVYPNPGKDIFNVKIENPENNIRIIVISITGAVIEIAEPTLTDGVYKLNLGNVAEGVYLLQVRNGDAYAVKRITVAR